MRATGSIQSLMETTLETIKGSIDANGSPSGKADKKHKFDRGILSIRQNNMVAERVIICYNRSCLLYTSRCV